MTRWRPCLSRESRGGVMEDREFRTGRHRGFHREHLLFLLHEIERTAERAAPELSAEDVANVSARLIAVISKIAQSPCTMERPDAARHPPECST